MWCEFGYVRDAHIDEDSDGDPRGSEWYDRGVTQGTCREISIDDNCDPRNGATHSWLDAVRTPETMPQTPCASERAEIPMNRSTEWDKHLIRYARKIWMGTDALERNLNKS